MSWLFSINRDIYRREKYIWAQVRIIHETDKAILVDNSRKFWLPKARICGIRLKGHTFEVYVREDDTTSGVIRAPSRGRTCNNQLRRLMLYPVELWAQLIDEYYTPF